MTSASTDTRRRLRGWLQAAGLLPLVFQAREIAAAAAAWRRNRAYRQSETSGWPLPPGRLAYLDQLAPDEREAFLAGRLVIRQAREAGSNRCAAYHPRGCLEALLAGEFVVLDSVPEGATGNPRQDLILLRCAP